MGLIHDAAKRLADAGASLDVILETIRDMESMKPTRKPKGDARATRLPGDWLLPKSWGEWALAEFPHLTHEFIRQEAGKFRDYWCSKPKDATKLDWEATWRNWIRKAAGDVGRPGNGRYGGPPLNNAIEQRRQSLRQRIEANGNGSERGHYSEPAGYLPAR